MKDNRIFTGVLFVAVAATLLSFDLPTSWHKAGNKPNSYEMGIDKGAGQDGKNAATIKSIDKQIEGFGTLMQSCMPGKYLGRRIRMTGMLKTKDVSDWAGLWLRIDTKEPTKAIVFDNMKNGKEDVSVKGTTDWGKYDIVLDVPDNAVNIAYGALLSGTGQVWFDNISFEIVPDALQTTGIELGTSGHKAATNLKEPANLDFER